MFSGFRCEVDEICALLGYYAASCGKQLPHDAAYLFYVSTLPSTISVGYERVVVRLYKVNPICDTFDARDLVTLIRGT
jgi:hypothetical protein